MVWSSVQRLTTHYPGGGLSFNDYLTIFKKLRVLVRDFQKDYARDFRPPVQFTMQSQPTVGKNTGKV